ncbi:MAG: hypothetical protein RL701_6327 [Pseudomonadota bacterium]|jgi:hypothetical protein
MDPKIENYLQAVVQTFNTGRQEILSIFGAMQTQAMVGQDVQAFQLLALRRYLRVGGARLVAQFPWTAVQQRTVYKMLIASLSAAADKVKLSFEAANPVTVQGGA